MTHQGPGDTHIQDFFLRELAEVYLLLDNVSASASKSLAPTRTGPPPPPADPAAANETKDIVAPGGDPAIAAWIKTICDVGWPPDERKGSEAKQAATLILAKDHLNALAAPATGATIAFTLLVVGEDNAEERRRKKAGGIFGRRTREPPPPPPEDDAATDDPGPRVIANWNKGAPSRMSLARLAYPGLLRSAHDFRLQIAGLLAFLCVALLATCLLSWSVTLGSGVLGRLNEVAKDRADVAKQIADATAADAKTAAGTTPATPLLPAPPLAKPSFVLANCDSSLCERKRQLDLSYDQAETNLAAWLRGWSYLKATRAPPVTPPGLSNQQWAAALLNVLSGSVLPILYGFLGAGAAIARSLSTRMRESLLSPRDFTLSLIRLALGAVIGACIGLFVTPVTTQGQPGLFGSVPLSASALCFIAGFGVEQVFVALEALLTRVFGTEEPARKS